MSDEALACIQQHVDRYRRGRLLRRRRAQRRAARASCKPRPGLYARLSEMHDCGLLGRMFPGVPGDPLPRRARLLPQVHGRRAHAADASGISSGCSTPAAPDRERFASLLADLQAPELLVLALLFHDVGKWRDDDHALESVRMAQADVRSPPAVATSSAPTVDVPDPRTTCRCRSSRSAATPRTRRSSRQFAALVGIEERLKMLCLMTLADVEAVSPRDADAVEGGAALAAVRRHLQPPDARLRRRAHRAGPGRLYRRCVAGRPTDLVGAEIARFPRRAAAPLPAAVRSRRDLPPRAARARHQPRRSARRRSSSKGSIWELTVRHARQAVPVLEHLRRAVVVRHGHPARPRDDQPERPGARRVPVHRRRAVPRAQRRRRRSRSCRTLRGRRGRPGRRHGAAARPRGERRRSAGARPACAARRPLRQRALAPLHDRSTSSPTTRSGCCTASAA